MRSVWIPVSILLFLANVLLGLRISDGGGSLAIRRPEVHHKVQLLIDADLYGQEASIKSYLPVSSDRQTVTSEKIESRNFSYTFTRQGENRRVEWKASDTSGHESILYEAVVDVEEVEYRLDESAVMPRHLPASAARYLAPTEKIQSDHPEVIALAERLAGEQSGLSLAGRIKALYGYVHEQVQSNDYENSLDAVTTLRWKQAYCGGQSRLLIALLRANGIPARITGGLILDRGSKRTTHVWVEAWVNGVWIPMDPLNGYFAVHPGHFLVLYHGDEVLFSRTKRINFQYLFSIRPVRVAPDEHLRTPKELLDGYGIWEGFRTAGVSLNLLRTILLMPVGILVVIFFRSVVGLSTFGTFHPALIAVAFRESGIYWGMALYVFILGGGILFRALLDRIRLLHTPRLAIVLLLVVGIMLVVTLAAVALGLNAPANISMFPIAILAITIEGSFNRWNEFGAAKAISIFLQTLFVIGAVYATLDSLFIQNLIFTFPEFLLMVGAAYICLGRYLGFRWLEYFRFRALLRQREVAS